MKVFALGAAVMASALFSKYELAISQDVHPINFQTGGCIVLYGDPESPVNPFDAFFCHVSESLPYDSFSCFKESVGLRLKEIRAVNS